jgi:glycosyltransferase involved in cell wall biosynthesis
VNSHRAERSKLHVVSLPGNLFRRWELEEILAAVPRRLTSPWKIFFSGVDWQRKGGDRTVAILNEVVAMGQPCELHVAGLHAPPHAVAAAKFPIHSLGRLNLNVAANREKLAHIMQESTFLLVPSTAEALALVYCEALSAGVPPMGSATGGVPDAVRDGETGILIQPEEPAVETARRMLAAAEPARYAAMAERCWRLWTAKFSMPAVMTQFTSILENVASVSLARKNGKY